MLVKQGGQKVNIGSILQKAHVPAAATACVITLAAPAVGRNVIHGIQWSYNDDPTGGRLTVTNLLGSVTFDLDIVSGGPGGFGCELVGIDATAVVITLASGAGTVQGKLNAQVSVDFE